eukprot:COSAG02_NODE_31993_length_524_cov_0.503529_1_plen_56_part_00
MNVGLGASVRIERKPAPGLVPSAEEVAAAVAWNEAWCTKNRKEEAAWKANEAAVS